MSSITGVAIGKKRNHEKRTYLGRRRHARYIYLRRHGCDDGKRYRVYNETLAYISQTERAGKLLVICPGNTLPVSRVEKDPEKLKAAYEIGRQTALTRLEEIRNFLGY